MLFDVTFRPSEIAEKHEECTDEPQTKQELSGRTILPEQPIKEQNRSFVAADSLAGEGLVLAGGGCVIFNN
jgi:hypothetical protein